MLLKYKTVLNMAITEFSEKKSRFITSVKPVSSEEEAREFIEAVKKKNWDAAHNVFAYQIGENDEIQRFSDDGEPQKTAGFPVLDVIRKEDIKNVAVVVTRYFGGTLLGTGGLVRAYTKAAKDGLACAGIIEVNKYNSLKISVDYGLSGKIKYVLLKENCILNNIEYSSFVQFYLYCEPAFAEKLIKEIIEVTGSKALIEENEDVYGYLINDEFKLLL